MRKKLLAAAALSTGVIMQIGCVNVFNTGNPPPYPDAPCNESAIDAGPSFDAANYPDAGAAADAGPRATTLSGRDAALPPCPKYDAGGYPDARPTHRTTLTPVVTLTPVFKPTRASRRTHARIV